MLPINICKKCNGNGKIKDENKNWIICDCCKGWGQSGVLEKDCTHCNGTGKCIENIPN